LRSRIKVRRMEVCGLCNWWRGLVEWSWRRVMTEVHDRGTEARLSERRNVPRKLETRVAYKMMESSLAMEYYCIYLLAFHDGSSPFSLPFFLCNIYRLFPTYFFNLQASELCSSAAVELCSAVSAASAAWCSIWTGFAWRSRTVIHLYSRGKDINEKPEAKLTF
jgi:hypothetical protein